MRENVLDLIGTLAGLAYAGLLFRGFWIFLKRRSYHDCERTMRYYLAAGGVEVIALISHVYGADWFGAGMNVFCLVFLAFTISYVSMTADRMEGIER